MDQRGEAASLVLDVLLLKDLKDGLGTGRNTSTGAVDGRAAALVEEVVITRRNDAPGEDDDILTALLLQALDELRNEGLVTSSEGGAADGVDISIDGGTSGLLGGLEERTDIDIEAEIGETSGDDLGAAIVAVLTHLGDVDTRLTTSGGLEVLDLLDDVGELVLVLGAAELLSVGTLDHLLGRSVSAPLGLEGARDLTEGAAGSHGIDGKVEKVVGIVAVTGGLLESGGVGKSLEAKSDLVVITSLLDLLEAGDLGGADGAVVDLEDIDGILLGELVLVDTDNDILAGVDAGLLSGSGLLDTELGHAGGDGLGHTTESLDLIDDLVGTLDELVGEVLDDVGTTEGIDGLADAGLLLDDELGVTGDSGGELGGETEGLIEGVGVEGLGSTHDGGHGLNGGTDDVVVGVLLGQTVAGGLAVGTEEEGLGVLGVELVSDTLGPDLTGGTHLGNLHVEVHADAPEEGETGADSVGVDSGGLGASDVLDTVGDGEGHLELGVGAGLLHVVAGDGDGVELGHVDGGVAHDILDDTEGLGRGVDEGVTDHELLENIVLDGTTELVLGDALLLGGDDVAGENGEDGAVHGHGDGHLVEGDAAEEDLHVLDAVDGDTGHTDITGDTGVVGVVASVGGEIEGDGETLLAGGEVLAVEGVGGLGSGEAGVLTDGPGLLSVPGV